MDFKIFKAYDIRGVYPTEIDEDAAYRVGQAFVRFLSAKRVAVGRDMRESGKSLFDNLAKGITDAGADVFDLGMVPTPVVSFAVARKRYDGGIIISASHNPSQYNAFKIVRYPAEQLSSETGIKEIEALCKKNKWKEVAKGKVLKASILEEYRSHVLKFGKGIRALRVVADYGNGVGSITSRPVLDALDIEAIHMFHEPDGTFPNHPANPHDLENLKMLQERVLKEKADCGIFYDGDADRSILVDEKGQIVPADFLVGLLAEEELKHHKREKVYYDLRFSKAVEEHIRNAGGIPVMMKVGNPFYKAALLKDGGVLAGEFSGHIMFRDNYCIDDGLFAAVKTLALMCDKSKRLSELIKPFQVYHQSEEINMTVKDGKAVMELLKKHYSKGVLLEIDGILIRFNDWWFSLRMSNTEPLVRLRIEADTAKLLTDKRREIMAHIKSLG
jgi:phosphomannomutase